MAGTFHREGTDLGDGKAGLGFGPAQRRQE